jgi:hypothetical protein
MRTVLPTDIAEYPALKYAVKKYAERGSQYVWGVNDCSVFVTDYLKGQAIPPKSRLTTVTLSQPDLTEFGLTQVQNAKDGDILNYRYLSQESNAKNGHCGVVVKLTNGLWVVHNCSAKGLVIQPFIDFLGTAKSLGVQEPQMRILRPINLSSTSRSFR